MIRVLRSTGRSATEYRVQCQYVNTMHVRDRVVLDFLCVQQYCTGVPGMYDVYGRISDGHVVDLSKGFSVLQRLFQHLAQ